MAYGTVNVLGVSDLELEIVRKIADKAAAKAKESVDSIQDQIDEMKSNFQDGCEKIANAITAEGVSTADNASPDIMATNIGEIRSGGNATSADILSGKTAYSGKSYIAGTMTNQGAKTQSLNCGNSYTIPAGYHNGSGKVTANSLSSQTGVDSGKTAAGASQILTGYQAWVNGSKVSGTMTNQGAKTQSLNCGGSYTIPAGYHNGSGKVTANSLSSQTGVDSGKTAAGASQILTGYQAWVNGSKVSGTMANKGAVTLTPTGNNTSTSGAGYYSSVTANGATAYTAGRNSRTLQRKVLNFTYSQGYITDVSGYQSFTVNNFALTNCQLTLQTWAQGTPTAKTTTVTGASLSYNASSGNIVCTFQKPTHNVSGSSNYMAAQASLSISIVLYYVN